MKPFLLLLYSVPLTVAIGVYPIITPLFEHISLALKTSHADPAFQAQWWDWWGLWIFFGGPAGRWVIGTLLGLYKLQKELPPHGSLGDAISLPSLTTTVVAGVVVFLAVFCLVRLLDSHLEFQLMELL